MNHAILLVVHLNELPKPTWIIVMYSFRISKSLENKPHKYIHTSIIILPTTQPVLQIKICKNQAKLANKHAENITHWNLYYFLIFVQMTLSYV
jgi:hypothetical protein